MTLLTRKGYEAPSYLLSDVRFCYILLTYNFIKEGVQRLFFDVFPIPIKAEKPNKKKQINFWRE